MTQEVAIDKDFIKNLPAGGTVDFDYVSTTRPKPIAAKDDPDDGGELSDDPEEDDEAESGEVGDARIDKSTSRMDGEGEAVEGEDGQVLQSSKPFTSSSSPARKTKISGNRRRQHTMMKKRPRGPLAITDDEFYTFLKKLGLSNRSKLASANAVFVLMDLQLASTKYYFTTAQINLLLDSFQDKWDIQSKVVITMFSRIKDLHNIDIVLRNLHSHAQQDIIRRIGCLNLINPLKPAFDYIFPLKYLDNRIMVVTLMELASIESADQIQEDPNTELPIATLYGSYTRAVNEVRPEVMKFSFADFGVRTNNISWPTRRDLVKKFLVGSQPVDEDMFKIITLFKEMENANGLSRGPIDLQYATFQKTLKGTQGRTTKTTKSLVNAMRTISNTRKSM